MDATIGSLTAPSPALRSAGEIASRVEPSARSPNAGDRESPAQTTDRSVQPRREVTDDAATGSIVFRLVDVATGDVTQQTPSEARLKLRVYIDHVTASGSAEPVLQRSA